MNKIFFAAGILFFLSTSQQAQAGFWDTKSKVKTPAKTTPLKTAQPVLEANRKIEARAKETLAAKDWVVYLTPIESKKPVIDMDVLTFSEGKFTSKSLLNKRYPISDFTITVSDNGRVDWEVVQMSENGDMAAWRGQLEADLMSGILSIHTLKGELEDFYFTSKQ